MTVGDFLNVGTAVAAALAAFYWFRSAAFKLPDLTVGWGGVMSKDHPWLTATARVAQLNQWGAIWAGVSALFAFASALASAISN